MLALVAAAGCSDRGTAASRPNVLFVLADDLGWGDLGSYGNADARTPHLDRMVEEGVRATEFYVAASVCTPSRAALLTGRYAVRMPLDPRGVFFPDSTGGLDPAEVTIAELLHERGYATALIGKWHLGHLPEYLPGRHGFEVFFGLPYSNDMDEPQYPGEPVPPRPCSSLLPDCRPGVPLMRDGTIVEMPAVQETLTRRYTDEAIAVMRSAVGEGRPFFILYAHHAPHVPLFVSDEFFGTTPSGATATSSPSSTRASASCCARSRRSASTARRSSSSRATTAPGSSGQPTHRSPRAAATPAAPARSGRERAPRSRAACGCP